MVKATPPCWFYLLIAVWCLVIPFVCVLEVKAQDKIPVLCASFSNDIGSPEFIDYLAILRGEDAWLGYPQEGEKPEWGVKHGFKNDVHPDQRVTIFWRMAETPQGTGAVQIETDPSHPQDVYLFVYRTIEPFTDKDGNWLGNHPCGAYLINPEEALKMIALAKNK